MYWYLFQKKDTGGNVVTETITDTAVWVVSVITIKNENCCIKLAESLMRVVEE